MSTGLIMSRSSPTLGRPAVVRTKACIVPSVRAITRHFALDGPRHARTCSLGSGAVRRGLSESTTASTRSSRTVARASAWRMDDMNLPGSGPIVVWFKNDLRCGDHPALLRACQSGRQVVPVFILDDDLHGPGACSSAAVLGAAAALRQQLQSLGSNLVFRRGSSAQELKAIVDEVGASCVVAQDDVEHAWDEATSRAAFEAGVPVVRWHAPLYEGDKYSDDYREFNFVKGIPLKPLPAPAALPPLPASLSPGDMPAADAVAKEWSDKGFTQGCWGGALGLNHLEYVRPAEPYPMPPPECLSVVDGLLSAGEEDLRAMVRTYARGAAPEGMAEVLACMALEAAPGQTFPASFSAAATLGVVSPRQITEDAASGPSWQKGTPAAVAAETAALWDWHAELARQSKGQQPDFGCQLRYWRWRGILTNYIKCSPKGSSEGQERPAVLLVHGFGAFANHFRFNIQEVADKGFDVYAVTLPGFGRSEKPALQYTQYLWRDVLVDFIRAVVQRPVVVAGNSIGGFQSAMLAGTYPELVNGLVLINTAGKIEPGYVHNPEDKPEPPSPNRSLIDIGSSLLFLYLQLGIQSTLRKVYPKNPDVADKWLAREIERASADPGALQVFKSGAYLPRPVPITHLIKTFGKPVLVLQGVLDPLNNAADRATQLGAVAPTVEVVRLEAGHCPHDEVPGEVNSYLADFASRCVAKARGGVLSVTSS